MNRCRWLLWPGLCLSAFVVSSCVGSQSGAVDEAGDDAQLSAPRVALASVLSQQFVDVGIEMEDGCVHDLVRDVSDADVELIIDADPDQIADALPTASEESLELIADRLPGCVDDDGLIEAVAFQVLEVPEDEIDLECLRRAVDSVDVAELLFNDIVALVELVLLCSE